MANENTDRIGSSPSVLTIGSVRVRFFAHKDHSVLASSGSSCSSFDDDNCCCSSSLPQISIANANNRNVSVYRSSLQWKYYNCFGADKFCENKNGVNLTKSNREPPPAIPRDLDIFQQRHSRQVFIEGEKLDRFRGFRFGGDNSGRGAKRGGNAHKKKNRSSDKTERLKQLTAKLSAPSTSQQEPTKKEMDVGSSVSEVTIKEDDVFNFPFTRPESRTIVGSYTQRTIPIRSASFSQVDQLPEGKYARQSQSMPRTFSQPPGSGTLPRKLLEKSQSRVNSSDEISDFMKSSSENLSGPKFSARALTHPLGKPLSQSSTNIPYNTSDECGLRSLSYQRILEEDTEVSHPPHASSLPPSPFPPPQPPKRHKNKLIKDSHAVKEDTSIAEVESTSKEENQSAEESLNIIKACCTQLSNFDTDKLVKNDVPLKSEEVDKNVFLSTWFSINEEENTDDVSDNTACDNSTYFDATKQSNLASDDKSTKCSKQGADFKQSCGQFSSLEEVNETIVIDTNNVESNINVGQILPDINKISSSDETTIRDGVKLEEPNKNELSTNSNLDKQLCDLSPPIQVVTDQNLKPQTESLNKELISSNPPRPKLNESSSKYRSEDNAVSQKDEKNVVRRFNLFSRTNSLSEGDSDHGDKNRESTVSPSPGDKLDYENRMQKIGYKGYKSDTQRRFSKKPRGPLLEAEVKKKNINKIQNDNLQLKFLDDIDTSQYRTVDDCHLKRTYSAASATNPPKRKNSIGAPYALFVAPPSAGIYHQRTTSSPSQLEGCAESNAKLFEQLMKGSSERLLAPGPATCGISNKKNCVDTRTHVVVELYETEKSYVEALQTVVTRYLEPLKSGELDDRLIEPSVVDEIFYQVPEILSEHEEFLDALKKRLDMWDIRQTVGDLILETFTKQSVVEAYTAFINNWKSAKDAIKSTCHSKPLFAKFLESMAREHKGKLALDSLLIMPVQRIPRYELLLQTLLKHTDENHADYSVLKEAQKEIHELAVKINCTERESIELEQIESLIDGLIHLVAAERTFLRHDLVTMASSQGTTRKERALFLFSDLLVITSIKRRSGNVRKCSNSSNHPGTIASTLEVNKYKLLTKIPLHDLDVVKMKDDNVRRMLREIDMLSEDISSLSQMIDLSEKLHCPHDQLEDMLRDVLGSLHKQLNERQNNDSQLTYLELILNTREGIENISMIFPSPEKRASWEESFSEAKQRLIISGERRMWPEFVAPVPIRKTRAGLQFTCAAPALGQRDVWVCNSDGYVGQVCVLSLYPEPSVISCNGVCNARILCVTSIPPIDHITTTSSENMFNNTGISISVEDTSAKSSANIQLDSSSSEDENDGDDDEPRYENEDDDGHAGADEDHQTQATMWLGTEDGCIHVYNCLDNIRIKKNKLKIQHGSAVHCIIYLENSVFVSLATGEVCVYTRDPTYGIWNISEPSIITVGSAATPVTKMLPVHNRLWCTCHNLIKVLNVTTLQIENSIIVGHVSCLVTTGTNSYGVWAALHNSSVMRLIHSISLEILCEVNIAPAVSKMLASCDDIIRQHKSACLRVTSLLACKELLWIGTSAGVVLTMPLPHINQNTSKITTTPIVSGVPHGHTGHVRFLTSVETPLRGSKTHSTNDKKKTSPRMRTRRTLVISGGDGYEDFRSSSLSEVAGREDSTNHLLLWHV